MRPYDGDRSRNLLHVNKLAEFTEYLKANHWKVEPPKGEYEVLRARHSDFKEPLLIYRRAATCLGNPISHYTTYGISQVWIRRFMKQKRLPPFEEG